MLSLTVGAFSAIASIISRLIVPGEVQPGAAADGAFIPPEVLLPGTLAALVGAFVAVWVACRWLDHRPVADLGLRLTREWWADLGFGLVLGTVAVGAVFALELAAGWVQITGFGPTEAGAAFWTEFAMVLVAFIAVGIYEEIVARG
jgi:membrane protease YdiL (CAAX protease family)